MRDLTLDIETYSSAPLEVVGVHRYAEAEDFEVQLISYCFDDAPVETVDLAQGEELPPALAAALTDPQVRKWAHNAPFERTCLAAWLGVELPPEQWWDDMVLCAVCGLPMGLGAAGAALGLGEDKAKDRAGKALIRWFAQPYAPTKTRPGGRHLPQDQPEKWAEYKEYNRQDVVAERAIHNLLAAWTPDEVEHRAWAMDQEINDRGVRIDLELATHAVEFNSRYKTELMEQAVALTGMDNPNSVAQVKDWLGQQEGLEVPSLNKKVVADVVARLQTDQAKDFMALRKELAKSSTAKYAAMVASTCADGHAKGCFQFYGAGRTGRWSGRRVQFQNMSKNKMADLDSCRQLVKRGDYETLKLLYGGVTDCLSELVRTAIIPEEGHHLIVCDYSAIEARVLAWISGEEWALEEFRGAGQIYEATGAMMFHVPKETIAKGGVNHDKRQAAKTAVLACVAEGQRVLTDHGVKPIEDVRVTDRVWDGVEWVGHAGVVCNGLRDTMFVNGVELTPDHAILTERGMIPCGRSQGLNWADVRIPDGVEMCEEHDVRIRAQENNVAVPLGHPISKRAKQAQQHHRGYPLGPDAPGRAGGDHREKVRYVADQVLPWKAVALTRGRAHVRVYDLLNAGPRHRFCLVAPDGTLRCVSNCGYGGGRNALLAFGADKMGMSEADMVETVDLWRAANRKTCQLWRSLEKAAIRCVVHGGRQVSRVGGIAFDFEQGILWMTLPSGRRIAYFGARYGDSRWGGGKRALSYMGWEKGKWTRLETWGGKLTENCWRGDTPVLTRRGWVAMETVRGDDLLWDGLEWVPHDGLADRGRRGVIELDGLAVTPDHEILTTEGWRHAEECEGLHRAQVQLPDGAWAQWGARPARQDEMDSGVRLRQSQELGHSGLAPAGAGGPSGLLWVPEEALYLRGPHDPRDEPTPGLCGVALHVGPMRQPESPSLEKLRGPRDHGLPSVAGELPAVLAGHGPDLSAGAGFGPPGQRPGIQSRELSLGDKSRELPEQARGQDDSLEGAAAAYTGGSRRDRHQLHHTTLPGGSRVAGGASPGQPLGEEQVYDLVNAGPRHRYVVLGRTGPILAHNCVQATARDCLRDAMLALRDDGYAIRAHIHDEVVISEPRDGRTLQQVAAVMGRPLPWAPGLPLRGDGYTCDYYIKD